MVKKATRSSSAAQGWLFLTRIPSIRLTKVTPLLQKTPRNYRLERGSEGLQRARWMAAAAILETTDRLKVPFGDKLVLLYRPTSNGISQTTR